jgi:hypothetical protein
VYYVLFPKENIFSNIKERGNLTQFGTNLEYCYICTGDNYKVDNMNQKTTRNQVRVGMVIKSIFNNSSCYSSRRGPNLKISRQLRFISRASLPLFMGAWMIGVTELIIR